MNIIKSRVVYADVTAGLVLKWIQQASKYARAGLSFGDFQVNDFPHLTRRLSRFLASM